MKIEEFTDEFLEGVLKDLLSDFGLKIVGIDRPEDHRIEILFLPNDRISELVIHYEKETNCLFGILFTSRMGVEVFDWRPIHHDEYLKKSLAEYYPLKIKKSIQKSLEFWGIYSHTINNKGETSESESKSEKETR